MTDEERNKGEKTSDELNPDPNCSLCGGTGKLGQILKGVSPHDGPHTCICVTSQLDVDMPPEEMTKEDLVEEVKAWRCGEIYQGLDRMKALECDALKAKVASMEKVVEAATWALHLAHGVGKAGGTPMPGEFESMAETLGTSLRALEVNKRLQSIE